MRWLILLTAVGCFAMADIDTGIYSTETGGPVEAEESLSYGWVTVTETDTMYEPIISLFGYTLYWVTETDLVNNEVHRYFQVKYEMSRDDTS